MKLPPENKVPSESNRHNSRLVAWALRDGFWSELPRKRKIGAVLFVVGIVALPFAGIVDDPIRWTFGALGLLAMIFGASLAYSGVDLEGKSVFPPE